MKKFLKELDIKKMNAQEIAILFNDNQLDIIKEYVANSHKEDYQKMLNVFFKKMGKKKFVKAIKHIIKSDDMEIEFGFAMIISSFLEKMVNSEDVSEDILVEYRDIIYKILKKPIKEITKKISLNKDVAMELLVAAPTQAYITNKNTLGIHSQRMIKKLYATAAKQDIGLSDSKTIKKLFKMLYGKNNLNRIAAHILLEYKDTLKNLTVEAQTTVWNAMTTFALDTIEKESKEKISKILQYYCDRRINDDKRNKDRARRIQLSSINEEEYPKIAKVVTKMKEKNKFNKYL